jgi:predicted secreted hydrolase
MRISSRVLVTACVCVLGVCSLQSAKRLIREGEYRLALPGYRYSFPRDFFNHPAFQTEWWYYTGNLHTEDGRRFGFELTFFRLGVSRETEKSEPWDVRDIYLAHLALSDLDGAQFYHTERVNRAGPGIAGADEGSRRIWNGNWQMQWRGDEQDLQAIADNFNLHLALKPEKSPVIHGENGVSQKAEGAGRASHYISLTRIATTGAITLNGKAFDVSGLSWMDHEFFTSQLTPEQVGWDWLSVQLEDRTELMLFHIRRKDGSVDPYSAGTYVDPAGKSTYLRESDFVLQPMNEIWRSAASGATYPIRWLVQVPKLGLQFVVQTPLAGQELTGSSDAQLVPTYWEGAISVRGKHGPEPVRGVGYLEMTGYAGAVQLVP